MPRYRRSLPALLVAVALVGSCSGGGNSTGSTSLDGAAPDDRAVTKGGDLVLALAEDADILDPSLGRTLVGREVFINLCEKLYDIDKQLTVIPQLAAALPETSADGC